MKTKNEHEMKHSRFMILRLLVKTLQNILTDNFIDTGVYFIDTAENVRIKHNFFFIF